MGASGGGGWRGTFAGQHQCPLSTKSFCLHRSGPGQQAELYLGPEKRLPGLRTRGPQEKITSHSLEGTRVAKVWFLGGAGTFISPCPRTQATQVGVPLLIRAGHAAGGEEFGRSCQTQRNRPHGVSRPSHSTSHLPESLLRAESHLLCPCWTTSS